MRSQPLKGLLPVLRAVRQHPTAPGVAACTPGMRAGRVGAPRVAPWGASEHPCRSCWLSPGSAASCRPQSPTHSSLSPAWLAGPRARLLCPSRLPQQSALPSPPGSPLPGCAALLPVSSCRHLGCNLTSLSAGQGRLGRKGFCSAGAPWSPALGREKGSTPCPGGFAALLPAFVSKPLSPSIGFTPKVPPAQSDGWRSCLGGARCLQERGIARPSAS